MTQHRLSRYRRRLLPISSLLQEFLEGLAGQVPRLARGGDRLTYNPVPLVVTRQVEKSIRKQTLLPPVLSGPVDLGPAADQRHVCQVDCRQEGH
jgi:hypothetical protein